MVRGDYSYAQPCAQGFYCEAASATPKGSGMCPLGFICPEGTAVPQPTPKGRFSELQGTIEAAECLPGYYTPTIESSECYPCPPGTSCEESGTFIVDICPPGTYRSTIEEDGLPCMACPQGTWSKNWELGEVGECVRCPAGAVCSSEAMTNPCGRADLPTPFEPVVSVDGVATQEYLVHPDERVYFSSYECLKLNSGWTTNEMDPFYQKYFFGELVPPYIDLLGRGAHFRPTNNDNRKYQLDNAKCYYNGQRYGTTLYQRFADYYGPAYDIQTGLPHQGYSPDDETYSGYFGTGSRYIDLPYARVFEAAYNCTHGIMLFNNDTSHDPTGTMVYTDPYNDPDVSPSFESRVIYKGDDYFYPGTCEADQICDFDSAADAERCAEGYVCEEESTKSESVLFYCREGYVCDFGTTPDVSLEAPMGQFHQLCPAGFVCADGTGLGQSERNSCPADHFCPTGTASALVGAMADDALNQGLTRDQADPFRNVVNAKYLANDQVMLVSDHDLHCFLGADIDFYDRYKTEWKRNDTDPPINLYNDYLRVPREGFHPYVDDVNVTGQNVSARPSILNYAKEQNLHCARDHKWRLVASAIHREECDCVTLFSVIGAVYRLWKCTGDGILEDLGLGSVESPYNGGRNFWFDRQNRTTQQCVFPDVDLSGDNPIVNLTAGYLPTPDSTKLSLAPSALGALNVSEGLNVQYTWLKKKKFETYDALKTAVVDEYDTEFTDLTAGTRDAMDPFIFDLRAAVRYVEEFGERLEELVWLDYDAAGGLYAPGRLDVCECERLTRCPNGTESAVGADDLYDCTASGDEVLVRMNAVPDWYRNASFMANGSDFSELSGTGEYDLGTLKLETLEVATITLDVNDLANNLTYDEHYRLGVYIDCKPCPARYQCNYRAEPPTCDWPSADYQQELYDQCLEDNTLKTYITINGTHVDPDDPDDPNIDNIRYVYREPDYYKCQSLPYFCDDVSWNRTTWQIVRDEDTGLALDETYQEASDFKYYQKIERETTGCCQCEYHSLPKYFSDGAYTGDSPDTGYPDNKHNYVQFTLTAIRDVELTVVLELLHGLYYPEFRELHNRGEISIHRPQRAKWGTDNSFLAILESEDLDSQGLALPLNLPRQYVRPAGTVLYSEELFENALLIDRTIDLDVADEEYLKIKVELNAELYGISRNVYNFTDNGRASNDLYPVPDDFEDVTQSDLWWMSGEVDEDTGEAVTNIYLSLPYFPYFSECNGYGSHMSIAKVLETHPDCTFYSQADTRWVEDYPWTGYTSPTADTCAVPVGSENKYKGVDLACTYEEQVDAAASSAGARWYESEAGTTLFYLSKQSFAVSSFEPGDGERWGRTADIDAIRDTYYKLPVEVLANEGEGNELVIPTRILLELAYYQKKDERLLVTAGVEFMDVCTTDTNSQNLVDFAREGIYPCDQDVNGDLKNQTYKLELLYYPMSWVPLLNRFEFSTMVYMAFYTVVGFITILLAVIIWGLNRLLTKLRHPPPFHSHTLFHIISEAPLVGVLLAVVPILLSVLWVWLWFHSSGPIANTDAQVEEYFSDPENAAISAPSALAFEGVAGNFQDSAKLVEEKVYFYRVGRIGASFVVMGLYVVFLCASLIVPEWSDEKSGDDVGVEEEGARDVYFDDDDEAPPPSPIWAPMLWKRAHLIWTALLLVAALLVMWEFSYSSMFENHFFVFIGIFKLLQMLMDLALSAVLRESFMIGALMIMIEVSEALITMGASSFVDFTLSYFMELAVLMLERLYLDPGLKEIAKLWPRWRMILRRKFGKRKRMTREEKAKEEMEWRRINEEIELESEGVEPLLDSYAVYANEVTALFLMPFVNVFLMVWGTETEIPDNYGIRENEMRFYTLFVAYIIPFSMVMDVFLLNAQELIHGWRVYDYISYQRYRFNVREHRWMLRNEILDESIKEPMQTLDLMCFSSQFYFINALFAMGMLLVMFGCTIFMRTDYNMFGDPVLPLMFMIIFMFGDLLKKVLLRLADVKIKRLQWRGLWVTKQIEGTVDDDVAAKLAVGEGRQADLEQERLELQALNSERFRHRFLERNRPWILQHLVELLTPRSLEGPGPDGRPVVEYIRDVYAELMAMGEGQRRPGDRSDISSESEDELEQQRRNWPRVPLTGANLAIARLWLAKARKRLAFHKLVTGIIDKNKALDCAVCGCTEGQGNRHLAVSLATGGAADPYALDRLIAEFESQYSAQESDPNLWKAFFRAKAEYITRCNLCMDQVEQDRLRRLVKGVGAGRATRAGDISSDDEEDDDVFDPVVVTRSSPEGRMMSKWLTAARKRLGGTFPRPDAKMQMEQYAEKMRKRKLRHQKQKPSRYGGLTGEKEAEDADRQWEATLNAASKALAQRWLMLARDSIASKWGQKGEAVREQLDQTLEKISEEEDWFFGAEMRLEGQRLRDDGEDLKQEHYSLKAEEEVKVRGLTRKFETFEVERRKKIEEETKEIEARIAEEFDKMSIEIELRTRELQRMRESKGKEFEEEENRIKQEEGAVSASLKEEHAKALAEIDDLIKTEQTRQERKRAQFEANQRALLAKKVEFEEEQIFDASTKLKGEVHRLHQATEKTVRDREKEWQAKAARWLSTARRKVEVKEREDAEAEEQRRRKRRRG